MVVDREAETISKMKLRHATYLTRAEIEAIMHGKLKSYMQKQIESYGELDVYCRSLTDQF